MLADTGFKRTPVVTPKLGPLRIQMFPRQQRTAGTGVSRVPDLRDGFGGLTFRKKKKFTARTRRCEDPEFRVIKNFVCTVSEIILQ